MPRLREDLEQRLIDFLDELVERGSYRNRDDALRDLLDQLQGSLPPPRPHHHGQDDAEQGSDDYEADGDMGGHVVIQLRIPVRRN
ncbi:hypothetical protein NCHU2750_07050 [Neorhizobium sp. NCHU2750]|nr:hypothetical protein NCHU2750_07050 [Neorhizobium sp. NCHU2750]